jgi:Na+/glutamate symporter
MERKRAMKNISTIQLSLFLMTSLMMTSLMVIPLMTIPFMTSLRTVLKRHDRKIGKKNP